MKKRMCAAAALAAVLSGPVSAHAATGSDGNTPSPYEIAVSARSKGTLEAKPQAIPGIVAFATVAGRGFTAARAPQQVSQALRMASFINGIFGGPAQARSNVPVSSIDVIFD